MSKSKLASKFTLVAVGTFSAAILVGIAAQPAIKSYAATRSAEYAATARASSNLSTKVGNYRLALALNPNNAAYRNELASTYIQQNNLEAAISALGRTEGERVRKATYQLSLGRYKQAESTIETQHTPEAAIVRSKIALEQGNASKAHQAVKMARNDLERLQMGFSYAAAGNYQQASRVWALMAEGELKQRLARAQNGGIALAQEFYKERLFRSAERELDRAGESSEKYMLSAYIQLELPGKNDRDQLEISKNKLIKGIEQDPANIKLRKVLVRIYRSLGDKEGIAREEQIIQKLQTGKL